MRFFCLCILIVASCKTIHPNGFERRHNEKQTIHAIEITFLNSGANYSEVMSAIQENCIRPQIQYSANHIYQPMIILSFTCDNMPEGRWMGLKKKISSCRGVIAVQDTVIN